MGDLQHILGTESYSHLPCWPGLRTFRCTHQPLPILKWETRMENIGFRKKPACLVIPELSPHTSLDRNIHFSEQPLTENDALCPKVCGWRKSSMGKPCTSLRSRIGLSQAQDKPLILCRDPCAMYHTVSPDKNQDWISHLLILRAADVYRHSYQHFNKALVPGDCLHILQLLSFQTLH